MTYPYVTPFDLLYPVRRKGEKLRMALHPRGFLHDGASGDPTIRGKRLNLVRDLSLSDSGKHDLRYLIGGDIILPEDAESWRDGELVPISRRRADFEYGLGLIKDHRYFTGIFRFCVLRCAGGAWKAHRKDDRDWRVKLEERMIENPETWEYDAQGWLLDKLKRKL